MHKYIKRLLEHLLPHQSIKHNDAALESDISNKLKTENVFEKDVRMLMVNRADVTCPVGLQYEVAIWGTLTLVDRPFAYTHCPFHVR